jgi:hypothetical protein
MPLTPGHPPSTHEKRVLRAALIAGAAVSIAVCCLIAWQWLILGAARAGWYYGYQQRFDLRFLAAWALAVLPGLALLFVPHAAMHRRPWLILLLWLAAAGWMQAGLRSVAPYTLDTLLTSDGASSFYGFAKQQPWSDVLAHFVRVTRTAPLHAQGNMPGKAGLIYLLQGITTRPDWMAWLLVGLSSLGGLLMYRFVLALFADRRAALYAAILYWFYPARTFFLPIMNTVTPVLVLGCACLLLRWLRTGRSSDAALLGVAVYGLVFFEPLPLVIGLLFAGLALRAIAIGAITPQQFALQSLAVLAAFIVTSETVNALTGFELVYSLNQMIARAAEFNEAAGRPYGFWALQNPAEFLFGVGACQAALFGSAFYCVMRDPAPLVRRLTHPLATICAGSLAVLLVVNLIGINRGETVRLWIFLGCFFQIPAAVACATLPGRSAILTLLACSALQATLGTAMIGFVVP